MCIASKAEVNQEQEGVEGRLLPVNLMLRVCNTSTPFAFVLRCMLAASSQHVCIVLLKIWCTARSSYSGFVTLASVRVLSNQCQLYCELPPNFWSCYDGWHYCSCQRVFIELCIRHVHWARCPDSRLALRHALWATRLHSSAATQQTLCMHACRSEAWTHGGVTGLALLYLVGSIRY